MSFALYGTPTPDTLFSAESFHDITIADADRIIQGGQLPHILPKSSLRAWVFDREVPTSLEELTLSANEHIPCAEDMLPITREMESAFHRGAHSVCLNLPNGSVRYHLSKIRLIINVNKNVANLAAAASLLNHVESSFLLLPDRIQELKGNKFMEPLAGFHVTAIPLYTLGCLLNERWAKEDVLNARAELAYFHRAVIKDLGQDPSFLFIPTSFINDCRTLIKLPGSPYSQNIIWFHERVRSGSVNVIGFLSWTRDHYSALVKMRIDDLEHGDSLNLPLNLIYCLCYGGHWLGFETLSPTSLAGEGSCGIAAANFVEFRIGMDIPRWMADQSADFRDLFLQEMLLYHLIACCKTTQYSDWVMPCFLSGNGEVPGFTSTDVGVGYSDFNLDMPSPDMTHPIFDWVTERLKQPQIFPEIAYSELQAKPGMASLASPFKLNSSTRNTIPSITQLAELPLDHAFNFPAISFGHSPRSPPKTPPPQPRNNIIVIPDTPSPAPPLPKTPPRRKIKDEDVMDLCSPDVIDLSLSTPPHLASKAEVIELTSPFQPGVKRKHEGRLPGAKVERIDIDLSSPPRRRTKQDSSLSSRLPPPQAPVQRQQPPRTIELGFGPIQLHNVYDTFETAEQAIYQAQEALGHKWIRGQVRRDDNTGALYWSEDRLTLADQPDVYLEFPHFLEDVVKWVADRRTRQTNRASNAMTLVRTSSDIFAGAGVYTITELWHMAGLSPNLTEAEAVCEAHSRDPLWVRRCTAAGPFDVFEPELIRHALEFEDINLGGLIFGEELWAKLRSDAGLPIACLSSDNTLARFYSNLSIAAEMSTSWLNPTAYTYLFHTNKGALRASHPLTILYRAANTNIWSVIPAFPDNSAPIP
ncbi:hypothetical protein MVEN_00243800 [Mycena venus]|uniref:Uncharacterized protein n=1 Tax=Mycena venus TaxID=2733690 RepID=A0A8H6Z2H1_9AGAR|nr:hypothetical protein MVEN_00243800 [Mycena venus]